MEEVKLLCNLTVENSIGKGLARWDGKFISLSNFQVSRREIAQAVAPEYLSHLKL